MLAVEQRKDNQFAAILTYLTTGVLPTDDQHARRVISHASLFGIEEGVLYYIDPKRQSRKQAVVPSHLKEKVIGSVHGGPWAGHFSNNLVYNLLVQSWWWDGMYTDVSKHCKSFPQCVFASGAGTIVTPPPPGTDTCSKAIPDSGD